MANHMYEYTFACDANVWSDAIDWYLINIGQNIFSYFIEVVTTDDIIYTGQVDPITLHRNGSCNKCEMYQCWFFNNGDILSSYMFVKYDQHGSVITTQYGVSLIGNPTDAIAFKLADPW